MIYYVIHVILLHDTPGTENERFCTENECHPLEMDRIGITVHKAKLSSPSGASPEPSPPSPRARRAAGRAARRMKIIELRKKQSITVPDRLFSVPDISRYHVYHDCITASFKST